MTQDQRILYLEGKGWTFSNWVPANRIDAPDDAQTAVMVKRHKHGTYYAEVEFDGGFFEGDQR